MAPKKGHNIRNAPYKTHPHLRLCHVGGEEAEPPVEGGGLVGELARPGLQRPAVRRQLLQRLDRLLGEGAQPALERVHVRPGGMEGG